MGLVTVASLTYHLAHRKTQVKVDFLSTIGCDVGAIGSYKWGSLRSGLLILEECREYANSFTTVN